MITVYLGLIYVDKTKHRGWGGRGYGLHPTLAVKTFIIIIFRDHAHANTYLLTALSFLRQCKFGAGLVSRGEQRPTSLAWWSRAEESYHICG